MLLPAIYQNLKFCHRGELFKEIPTVQSWHVSVFELLLQVVGSYWPGQPFLKITIQFLEMTV